MTSSVNPAYDHLFDAVEAIIVQPASDQVTQRLARLRTLIDSVLPQENRVATAIRTLRQNLGLTQSEFGKKVGNTRQANVAQWEAGGCEPAPRTRPAIAALAGYSRWAEFIEFYAASSDRTIATATIGGSELADTIVAAVANAPKGKVPFSWLKTKRGISSYSKELVEATLALLVEQGVLIDTAKNRPPRPGEGSVLALPHWG